MTFKAVQFQERAKDAHVFFPQVYQNDVKQRMSGSLAASCHTETLIYIHIQYIYASTLDHLTLREKMKQ